jgi:hypothetical protein
MRTFDPVKVAHYEKEAWVAYYQRRWLRLLRMLIALVRETFGLSLWQALYVGLPLTRAQIAFAPKDNDVPAAVADMRRFYTFVQRVHGEDFDPDVVARLDVDWWVVHRQLFGRSDDPELIEALVKLYAATYRVDPDSVRAAAYHRVQAMVHSDRWIVEGKAENSPLLAQEEEELVKSYTALRAAVSVTAGA